MGHIIITHRAPSALGSSKPPTTDDFSALSLCPLVISGPLFLKPRGILDATQICTHIVTRNIRLVWSPPAAPAACPDSGVVEAPSQPLPKTTATLSRQRHTSQSADPAPGYPARVSHTLLHLFSPCHTRCSLVSRRLPHACRLPGPGLFVRGRGLLRPSAVGRTSPKGQASIEVGGPGPYSTPLPVCLCVCVCACVCACSCARVCVCLLVHPRTLRFIRARSWSWRHCYLCCTTCCP